MQRGNALRALRRRELVSYLVAGLVAASTRTAWLPYEADREASFSVYKTDHPATELNQPFLLVSRTRHIVTREILSDITSSAGYSDVPAYSQVLQLPRSTDSYGRRLPGLSFAASGQALTTPRNLPAPGRRQPLYVVLRLSRDLCFW